MKNYYKNTNENFGDDQPFEADSVDDFACGAEDNCLVWAEEEYFHPDTNDTGESKSDFIDRRAAELMDEFKSGIVLCDENGNEIVD